MRRLRNFLLPSLLALLSGCNAVVLDPSGDVAVQQRDLLIESAALMLLIIVPVMAVTVWFAWRYRHSNTEARYEPDWDHSTQLELIIWGAPLLIIICLGALTWMGTHLLDPYRPIDRIAAGQPVPGKATPLEVEAVALDWKWLFFYPQYGIASVNEMAAPVDREVDFRITSATVMNSFYVPALAGQVYAMAGMETRLHAVMNKPGQFRGFSANYSGAGFSGMHFVYQSLDASGFDKWVAAIKAKGGALTRDAYLQLAKPSENEPVHTYAGVEDGLYKVILNQCAEPGKMCMNQMMAIDAKGGLGLAGVSQLMPRKADQAQKAAVAALCTTSGAKMAMSRAVAPAPLAPASSPVLGAGLPRPHGLLSSQAAPASAPGRPSNS